MKTLFRSFAGGEITPEMAGRVDLAKYQTGLAECVNTEILPHGPAARRAGTLYQLHSRYSSTRTARLIPFQYSADQACIVEFGHLYVRFHTRSGAELEAAKAVTGVTLGTSTIVHVIGHGYSAGDCVYLAGVNSVAELRSRFVQVGTVVDADHFHALNLAAGGTAIDTTASPAFSDVGATAARVYTLTSPYTEAQLPSLKYTQSADVLTIATRTGTTQELRRLGAHNWAFAAVDFAVTLAAPASPSAVATIPTATSPTAQHYVITSVAADLVTQSAPTADVTCNNNLTIYGNFNTISWTAEPAAARYYVYKKRGGAYGYIGQTTETSLIDDNITPDTLTTPPSEIIQLCTDTATFADMPGATTYHQQRRWFGGTATDPAKIWATRNGTENNMTSSVPERDDDALEFRLASQQQHSIQHLLSKNDLIALTVSGEFRVLSSDTGAITFKTLDVKSQTSIGAAPAQPVLTPNAVLYSQSRGAMIRAIEYDPTGQGYLRSLDVSLLAPHLFNGYTISELAFTLSPLPCLRAARSDGALLGMTYVAEQAIYAWHRHSLGDAVESVASITEGGEDSLYLIVRRTINGSTERYLERQSPRVFADDKDAHYVDAGLIYDGAPTTALSGLWHLEGATVSVLADGGDEGDMVVVNGALALPIAASVVHVGVPFTSRIRLLPLAFETLPASGQGTYKNVKHVYLRAYRSSGFKAGPSLDKLVEFRSRSATDDYDSAPVLRNEEFSLGIDPSWNPDGAVYVVQDRPLPLTITAMALDVAQGS